MGSGTPKPAKVWREPKSPTTLNPSAAGLAATANVEAFNTVSGAVTPRAEAALEGVRVWGLGFGVVTRV